MPKTLFLVGATASGKKSAAQLMVEDLSASLLSLDSMKVYRGLDRGTDKEPGRFLLTDLVDASESFSVGEYVSCAAEAVARIHAAGRRPLFVGGTGLYLRSLVRGLFNGPRFSEAVRSRLLDRVRVEGSPALHRELLQRDPATAARVHPNDARRITRALEVVEQTGRTMSEWQAEHTVRPIPGEMHLVGIRWPNDLLRHRIERRVDRMLEEGLVNEVRTLREKGRLGTHAAEAIGYREALSLLSGQISLKACREQIVAHTWQLSRRQENWFLQFPEIQWVHPSPEDGPEELARRVFLQFRQPC